MTLKSSAAARRPVLHSECGPRFAARARGRYELANADQAHSASGRVTAVSARVFIPKNLRGSMEALPPADRVDVETHLENLSALALGDDYFRAFAGFEQQDGRYVTAPSARLRTHFTIDPMTRVIYLHVVELLQPR